MKRGLLLLFTGLLLIGCTASPTEQSPSATVAPTESTPIATTPTDVPTSTRTPTAAPQASPTPTVFGSEAPTPFPMPENDSFELENIPKLPGLDQDDPLLSMDFAGQLPDGARFRLNSGLLNTFRFSPDAEYLSIGGSAGVWVYETDHWNLVWMNITAGTVGAWSPNRAGMGWSPDGAILAAGDSSGTIYLWQAEDGSLIRKLTGHEPASGDMQLVWSNDGSLLVSGSDNGEVIVWEVATGRIIQTFSTKREPNLAVGSGVDLSFSPDNTRLIFSGFNYYSCNPGPTKKTSLWDIATGAKLAELGTGAHYPRCMDTVLWSSDGSRLVVACEYGEQSIEVRDGHSGDLLHTLTGHKDEIFHLHWLDDEQTLLSWDRTGLAIKWDMDTYKAQELFNMNVGVSLEEEIHLVEYLMEWSSDDRAFAVNLGGAFEGSIRNDEVIVVGSLESRQIINRVIGRVEAIGWRGDQPLIVAQPTYSGYTPYHVFDGRTGEILFSWRSTGTVTDVVWSPDGRTLAAGFYDQNWNNNNIMLWDASSGERIQVLEDQTYLDGLSWSPVDNTIAYQIRKPDESNTSLVLANALTGEHIETLFSSGMRSNQTTRFHPDGHQLFYFNKGKHVLDLTTGQVFRPEPREWEWYYGIVDVAWSPNGQAIATVVGTDSFCLFEHSMFGNPQPIQSAIEIFDSTLSSMDQSLTIPNECFTSVAWSPDNEWLAVGGTSIASGTYDDAIFRPGDIIIWDTQTWEPAFRLSGTLIQIGDTYHAGIGPVDLAYSPDGKWLAAGYTDMAAWMLPYAPSVVVIWDIEQQQIHQIFEGHSDDITSLAWSPDGALIASGSEDGTVIVWEVSQ